MRRNFNLPPGIRLRDLDPGDTDSDTLIKQENEAADSAREWAKDRAIMQMIQISCGFFPKH